MTVKTKQVEGRRQLRFGRMNDILADVIAISERPHRALGNWTPAQNIDHLAAVIESSLDGFEDTVNPVLRVAGRLMRNSILNRPMKPGFKVPTNFKRLAPVADVTLDDAVARMRAAMERIESGTRMNQRSPLVGDLAHEQWEQMHCRHAEMHLSFIVFDD